MANARTCDGPKCDHVGPANPEGWLHVTVDVVLGESELKGQHDFASVECFEAWLAQFLPAPEQPKKKR